MKVTTSQAYANLKARRNPEQDTTIFEAFDALPESEAVKYLAGAMEPIPPTYTANTIQEAERVRNQITKGLEVEGLGAEFEIQGSVIKNTHIRGYSDVDLLVVEGRFITYGPSQQVAVPYTGDPVKDLLQIRRIVINRLTTSFWEATVDSSGAKSVKISGGSLRRTVDVVPGNWFHTAEYSESRNRVLLEVQILDAHKEARGKPDPLFLHGAWLDHQEARTGGNGKKLIRLLKSLKYESSLGKAAMSSYDIESIVFRMDEEELKKFSRGQELALALHCYGWLHLLEQDQRLRESLDTPDQRRKIFSDGFATLTQLRDLKTDLGQLLNEIQRGLSNSARKLAEARLSFPSAPSRPWGF
jgi:hypothetical protein